MEWEASSNRPRAACAIAKYDKYVGIYVVPPGLAVRLRVEDKSLPQAELAELVTEAHEKICPYSHATRGNVNVQLEVAGA